MAARVDEGAGVDKVNPIPCRLWLSYTSAPSPLPPTLAKAGIDEGAGVDL